MIDEEENKCLTEYKKLFCTNCEADCTTSILDCNGYQFFFKGYEQGYEGCRHYAHDYYKPKWHDLRKNPDDLPKEKTMYRVIYDNPMINRPAMWYLPNLKSWEYSNLPIIAWCELPKFEE